MESLQNINPIDGRYYDRTRDISNYFSEHAYFFYRLTVEIDYLFFLNNMGLTTIKSKDFNKLTSLLTNYNINSSIKIKEIEIKCNHDVKSIEYFIRNNINDNKLKEYVHFGLTSQDINCTANILRLRDFTDKYLLPTIDSLNQKLKSISETLSNVVMVSRTHGQPATPTTMGKEIKVFQDRLQKQLLILKNYKYSTKFGGSVGNLNAHYIAFPEIDWITKMDEFINNYGVERNRYTTQIDQYDNYSELFDIFKRINNIIIDLDMDIWTYISMNYFNQKINKNEVGSSTMPHKINPINFENSEGNLLLSNNLLGFLSDKLPKSRLQRDLTDSTITRNIGSAVSYMIIGIKSCLEGLNKLEINQKVIDKDLNNNWNIISEGIQTILRSHGVVNSYELLKNLTRTNSEINKEIFKSFVDNLDIDTHIKSKLYNLTPKNYIKLDDYNTNINTNNNINNNNTNNINNTNTNIDYNNNNTSRLGAWNTFWRDRKHRGNSAGCNIMDKAIAYLLNDENIKIIEDWGCGNCVLKKYVESKKIYVGVDGSDTGYQDKIQDLEKYTTNVDAIYMQHVLEHNQEWEKIFRNLLQSFKYKAVLVLFTPFTEETKVLTHNTLKSKNNYGQQIQVNDIAFCKKDLVKIIEEYNIEWFSEENIKSNHNYKIDHILYFNK